MDIYSSTSKLHNNLTDDEEDNLQKLTNTHVQLMRCGGSGQGLQRLNCTVDEPLLYLEAALHVLHQTNRLFTAAKPV